MIFQYGSKPVLLNWIRSHTTENTLPDKNHCKGQRKNLRNPEVPLQHVHNQLTNTFLKFEYSTYKLPMQCYYS